MSLDEFGTKEIVEAYVDLDKTISIMHQEENCKRKFIEIIRRRTGKIPKGIKRHGIFHVNDVMCAWIVTGYIDKEE